MSVHYFSGCSFPSTLRPPPLARFAHDEETGELMTIAIRPDGNTYVSTVRCLANGSKENFAALFAPPGPGETLPTLLERSESMEFPITPSSGGGGGSSGDGDTPCGGLVSYTRVTDFAGFPQSFARYTGVLGGAIGSYVTHPQGEGAGSHPFVVLSSVTSAATVLSGGSGSSAHGSMSAIAADAAPYVRAAFAAMVGGYGSPLVNARADMPGLAGTAVAAGVAFRLLQGTLAEDCEAAVLIGEGRKLPWTIEEELKDLRKGRKSAGARSHAGANTAAGPKPKFRRVRNRDPATRDSPAFAKIVRNRESARRSNERKRLERLCAAAAAAASAGAGDLVDAAGGGGADVGTALELAQTDTVPLLTASVVGVRDSLLQVTGGAQEDGGVARSGRAAPSPPSFADWQLWAGSLPAPGWSGSPAQPAGKPLSLEFTVASE
eukprot:contig_2398_g453